MSYAYHINCFYPLNLPLLNHRFLSNIPYRTFHWLPTSFHGSIFPKLFSHPNSLSRRSSSPFFLKLSFHLYGFSTRSKSTVLLFKVFQTVVMRDKVTGKPRGFGFVFFSDPDVLDGVLKYRHVIDGRTGASSVSSHLVRLPPIKLPISDTTFCLPNLNIITPCSTSGDAATLMKRLTILIDLDPATARTAIIILTTLLPAFAFLFVVRIFMSWYPKLPVGYETYENQQRRLSRDTGQPLSSTLTSLLEISLANLSFSALRHTCLDCFLQRLLCSEMIQCSIAERS